MSTLIPHCWNQLKIIFWAWEGSNFIKMKNFKKQKSFILCLAPPVLWVGPKSEFCILSDPPNFKPTLSKFLHQKAYWGHIWHPRAPQKVPLEPLDLVSHHFWVYMSLEGARSEKNWKYGPKTRFWSSFGLKAHFFYQICFLKSPNNDLPNHVAKLALLRELLDVK